MSARKALSAGVWIARRIWPVPVTRIIRASAPAFGLVCVSLLGSAFVGFATDHTHRVREARLTEANAELRNQVAALKQRLDERSSTTDRSTLTSTDLDTLVQQARTLAFSWDRAATSLETRHAQLTATPSILPTVGFLTSAFSKSRWHPILNRARPHEGIDISAPLGTRVLAAANGTVARVGYFGQYGLLIEVSHGHGYVTRYAHLKRALVRPGQFVQRGSKIGEVGESGLAIGPHLHYEVLLDGVARNPLSYILDGAIPD